MQIVKKQNIGNLIFIAIILLLSATMTFVPCIAVSSRLYMADSLLPMTVRIFTCHLVHWTAEHFIYDILCFVLIACFLSWRRALLAMFVSAITISIGVLNLYTNLDSYCGLSGVNCCLFALFAIDLVHRNKKLGIVALFSIIMKTAFEIAAKRTFFATSGFIPVHCAHVIGILTGIALCLISYIETKEKVRAIKCDARKSGMSLPAGDNTVCSSITKRHL